MSDSTPCYRRTYSIECGQAASWRVEIPVPDGAHRYVCTPHVGLACVDFAAGLAGVHLTVVSMEPNR